MYTLEEHKQHWVDAGVEYGLCLCGCGGITEISNVNAHGKNKRIKGQPNRKIWGHAKKSRKGPNNTLSCYNCGEYKGKNEFYKKINGYHGVGELCIVCCKKSNVSKKSHLKRYYGITIEQVTRMQEEQDNKCAICNASFEETRMCVDHDHITNKVRALLCDGCNRGLGTFKENPERLRAAADYIERHLTADVRGATIQ